ncbi:MAG: hypothetical protein KUG67_02990 [Proteobacteria bacterium]|nr:hypothetical protein [Pseudomonadota bacterium]
MIRELLSPHLKIDKFPAWDGHFGLPPTGAIQSTRCYLASKCHLANEWVLGVNKASAFEMDALDSRIKELVAYARERDGEDRSNLFRNLVDLFLTGKAPQIAPTRGQLLDVLQALIPHVEAEGRRTASDLIANMSKPPMDLVMRLAHDRASLVSSLLTQVAFEDDDLIALIEQTGREHHQVIASREDLSANIWIALARAAPGAPPFDNNSTLALWSEDLGITQTKAPNASEALDTIAAGETGTAAAIAPAIGNPRKAAADRAQRQGQKGATVQKSATVTAIHPQRGTNTGAAIRILRTDEDLIASRTAQQDSALPHGNTDRGTAPDADANTGMGPNTHDNQTQPFADTLPSEQDDIALVRKHALDPGPGGWAWISDRDGFVTSLSAQGQQLLGTEISSIGTSMLDLLGLNTKLGHPVARAFQRRSGIHDAPIFLPDLEEKQQHWTLEATPYFSACGGIFEGYEGVLTPVVSAANDAGLLRNDDEANALFLDEIAARPAASLRIMPAAFTEQATVFQTERSSPANVNTDSAASGQSENAQPVEALIPTQQTLEAIASELSAPDDTMFSEPEVAAPTRQTTAAAPSDGGDADPLSRVAASVMKDVLAEALAPLAAKEVAQRQPDTAKAALKKKPQEKAQLRAEALTSTEVSAHIGATFDLLEEALNRLTEAGKASGDPQTRLQGEIASACVRSLREQLK